MESIRKISAFGFNKEYMDESDFLERYKMLINDKNLEEWHDLWDPVQRFKDISGNNKYNEFKEINTINFVDINPENDEELYNNTKYENNDNRKRYS